MKKIFGFALLFTLTATALAADRKLIALTFDDGPDPKYTPQIMDILRQYGAQAQRNA